MYLLFGDGESESLPKGFSCLSEISSEAQLGSLLDTGSCSNGDGDREVSPRCCSSSCMRLLFFVFFVALDPLSDLFLGAFFLADYDV